MKLTTQFTKDAWLSGDYTGDQRPAARATVAKWHAERVPYNLGWGRSKDWHHRGHYVNCLFNQDGQVRELHNVKSIKISRGVEVDAASCTIVLYNVNYFADQPNARLEEFDYPGWFTPNRGQNDLWDYGSNRWENWLIPDRMIRTFEGYGIDPTALPEDDPHMYPSGVWLIDDVRFSTDGLITITCRDLGKLLLDQILFPPIVPFDVYPLWWEAFEEVPNEWDWVPTGGWLSPTYNKDSNELVAAAGLMDGTRPAVDPTTGRVRGHSGNQAQDEDTSTYWLSAGSEDPHQLEWIEFNLPNDGVKGVRINVKGGPYKVYISVFNFGRWRGSARIPYEIADDGTDLNADIKYVRQARIDKGETRVITIPKYYANATKIRLTFASRWDSGIGQRRYRTAVREVKYAPDVERVPGTGTDTLGNYDDYTDIIKWLTGWAGFFWPKNATVKRADGVKYPMAWATEDDDLRKGRIWGDFQKTKTAGIVKLDVDMFDKKPVMDGIAAIREIVGFDFWIDESGAAIWRLPNVWKPGSYIMPTTGYTGRGRTQDIVTIDERQTLIDLESTLSAKNIRERIFVADVNGNFGTTVRGFNPARSGMKRVGGWTDQHFRNRRETKRVAELIAVRQAFTYRTNTLTIAANPALQIDDQIIIRERMTGEGYRHRILAIDSEFDVETGRWTYALTTAWLGAEAFTANAWEPKLSAGTKAYLNAMDY